MLLRVQLAHTPIIYIRPPSPRVGALAHQESKYQVVLVGEAIHWARRL